MKRQIALYIEATGEFWYKGAFPYKFVIAENDKETFETSNFRKVVPYLEDANIEIIMHDAKFVLTMLKQLNYDIDKLIGRIEDTVALVHIISELQNTDLPKLKQLHESDLDDAELILYLYEFYTNKIIEEDSQIKGDLPTQMSLYKQELDLVWVLVDMEFLGLRIDVPYFAKLQEEYQAKIPALEENIYTIAGEHFNMKSTKQLATLLLKEGANLPVTAKGNFQVNEEVLSILDTPLANAIVDYRKTKKILTTYIDRILLERIDDNIYPWLNSNKAKTGRFSSNMHNIPKPDEDEPETYLIRSGFIPREGSKQYYFDYKQQEYRAFMDYAKAIDIIRKINDEDADYHDIVHDKMKHIIPTRKKTKTFNFLIVYGGGCNAMVKKIGMTHQQAMISRKEYFEEFPDVQKLFKNVKDIVAFRGFLINKYGRRRRLSTSESYIGVNFIVQGSCADFIKNRMIEIHKLLKPYKSNMVYQIHDELVFDIVYDEEFLVPKIKEIMEDTQGKFNVKMKVDIEYAAPNWATKAKYKGE